MQHVQPAHWPVAEDMPSPCCTVADSVQTKTISIWCIWQPAAVCVAVGCALPCWQSRALLAHAAVQEHLSCCAAVPPAGKQAEVLNQVIGELLDGHPVSDVKLKEVLGHTPLQVRDRQRHRTA